MLKKIIITINKFGWKHTFSKLVSGLFRRFSIPTELRITKTEVNHELVNRFSNRVQHGQFKGLDLASDVWWGIHDSGSKILGQYESHVLKQIVDLSKFYNHFVDIGAADGYYAVGVLKSGIFDKSVCFEISEKGRKVIENNSIINGVRDKIDILGVATSNELYKILSETPPSVILCDVEGAEYNILSDEVLGASKQSSFIIETHKSHDPSEYNSLHDKLLLRASKYFNVALLKRENPDIYSFRELDLLSDDARLLIFSESRTHNMEWICLTPK